MNFLASAMTLGAAAAAVPIIIHLLNRRRCRTVSWGAMHLLDPVVRVNRRRVRLEQLLLLAVRAALPAAIALFMARPVLTGWRSPAGDAPASLVILLDDSASMQAGGPGASAFDMARSETARIIGGMPRGSEAYVIPMAGPPLVDAPTSNLDALAQAVLRLEGGYGSADVPGALAQAAEAFAFMRHAVRDILVLSDFQRVSWGDAAHEAIVRAGALRGEQRVKPTLTLQPVGREFTENTCVESLELSHVLVGVGRRLEVTAHLRHYGRSPRDGLRVRFSVNGELRETAEISLGAGERGQVVFVCSFTQSGSHWVEAAADEDALPADDTLAAALEVWDSMPVLLVDGAPGGGPLDGAAAYLAVALGPFAAGGAAGADLFSPRVIEAGALAAALRADVRVVVLADVPRLSSPGLDALAEFVRTGGGLLVFPGPRCDTAWYNAALAADGGALLPRRLGRLQGGEGRGATSVRAAHYSHPALAVFNVPGKGSLADVEIRRWFALEDPPGGADPSLLAPASLASGDAFLVEKTYGQGRVILCATSCDAAWNSMPLRSCYVPLMQGLVMHLASTAYPPRNVEVGEPLVVLAPAQQAGTALTVIDPAGAAGAMVLRAHGVRSFAEYRDTLRPGRYVVEGTGRGPLHYVVTAPRIESAPARLDAAQMRALAEALDADVVDPAAGYVALDAVRRYGRDARMFFFWCILGLAAAELVLERLFTRRRA